MKNIKLILLIELLFQLCISINLETIEYMNPIERKGQINQRKTYEIKFPSENIPDYLHLNLNSTNNIKQIISFSTKNENCLNGRKIMATKSYIYLEKSQLSLKRNYICIQCENPNENCEFNFILKPGKIGIKIEEDKIQPQKNLNFFLNENNLDDKPKLMISKDFSITLYFMRSVFSDKLAIPSDKMQKYQIDSGKSGKYKVISGETARVEPDGVIYPKNETWYCTQGRFYFCTSWPSGSPNEIVDVRYTEGKSVVQATVNDKTYKITVNVLDYPEEYVNNILKEYIKNNITSKMSQLEKYDKIAAFPAQYPYKAGYASCTGMVIYGGGDCWASTDAILRLCKMVGIKAHARSASSDSGAGSGHQNVIALINGKYYIAEAGYGIESPNRIYNIYEEPLGYSIKSASNNNIYIYQYDGYDLDIKVPTSINGKTVIGLKERVFVGPSKDAKKISLPKTCTYLKEGALSSLTTLKKIKITKNIQYIDADVFYDSQKLEKIEIESGNKNFSSKDGVLYDKEKKILITYPPGKELDKYECASTVEKIGYRAFYYIQKLKAVVIPKKTTSIESYAFSSSSIKEIYFRGDPPKFADKIFSSLNLSVYYPEGNEKWKKVINSTDVYGAKAIRYYTWKPSTSKKALAIFITVFCILIIGIFVYTFIKKKGKMKDSFSLDFSFKTLLNKN